MASLPTSVLRKRAEEYSKTIHYKIIPNPEVFATIPLKFEKFRSWEKQTMERSLNILLADDEEIVHKTVASYLRDLGHHVDIAYSSHTALRAIEHRQYDLGLINIRMACVDSLSFLTEIRKTRPEMSVIIITGHGNMDMAIKSLRLGAADFLTKPIKLLELDAVLEKSIRLHTLVIQKSQLMEKIQAAYGELEARVADQTSNAERDNKRMQVEIDSLKKNLQEAERRYLLLARTMKDMLWETDMNLRFAHVSPSIAAMLGYSVEEMMHLAWKEILTERSAEIFERAFVEELASADRKKNDSLSSRKMNIELMHNNSSIVCAETTFSLLYGLDSRPVGTLGILRETDKHEGTKKSEDQQ